MLCKSDISSTRCRSTHSTEWCIWKQFSFVLFLHCWCRLSCQLSPPYGLHVLSPSASSRSRSALRQLVWQELNEMLYLNKISRYLGFQGVYNAFVTKALHSRFFFHFTCEWCVEIHWFRWRVKPSPNRHLSSFFLSFLSKDGLMFPICGKGNSIFPLSLFLTLVALPPSESGSILLFRSHSAAEKKPGRCDKSGLTLKSPPPSKKKKKTHKGFPLDRFLTQWLSLNPKLGRFSFFLSLSLATAGFSKHRESERESAKKHFISDPIISSA